jgi:hypothetical protein
MYIFLGQKKYGIWGDFSEKFQVLCGVAEPLHFEKFNPDPHQSQKQDL